jgi:hypothetical protein
MMTKTIEVTRALDGNLKQYGWHLIVNGDWHETYATKRDAKAAAALLAKLEG